MNPLFFDFDFAFHGVFDCCFFHSVFLFYCICYFNCVLFALFEFLQDFLVLDDYFGNSLLVGFGLVVFAPELEGDLFAFYCLAAGPFECGFDCGINIKKFI